MGHNSYRLMTEVCVSHFLMTITQLTNFQVLSAKTNMRDFKYMYCACWVTPTEWQINTANWQRNGKKIRCNIGTLVLLKQKSCLVTSIKWSWREKQIQIWRQYWGLLLINLWGWVERQNCGMKNKWPGYVLTLLINYCSLIVHNTAKFTTCLNSQTAAQLCNNQHNCLH